MEVVLCVTGSVAAVEAVKLARELKRRGLSVKCFMSDGATEILHPNAMEFATGQEVVLSLTGKIEHVKYAQADLILVAPATANVISKLACRIADNPINTLLITAFGYGTPIIFVPSMHHSMYKAISPNIEKLEERITFIKPKLEEKKAKFPDIEDIVLHVLRETSNDDLAGKKILISTGATYEKLDEVRGITNLSSGKTGVELAKEAFIRGADVTLICGHQDVDVPQIFKVINVGSVGDMQEAVLEQIPDHEIFISAAAVSDFIPQRNKGMTKISSSEDIVLKLERAPKIINQVKKINPEIFLVSFKAEYDISEEELIKSARKKMSEFDADLIIANDVSKEGAGFGSDDNEVLIINNEEVLKVPLASKTEIAREILDKILELI
ncbi:MAG TPA: bifunctional phosphopantothenoylcysteine decarboxylase/phosphopantothenate--cysteine ligase CoaBC [Methanobacterium sp.]|nr:bifunctional phosphopantothenoylcysteine decarboxylase/phosphopantothenate--cysteine ligase CoaBC [Methanobacterium sp.]